jgi:hypothetical protein
VENGDSSSGSFLLKVFDSKASLSMLLLFLLKTTFDCLSSPVVVLKTGPSEYNSVRLVV